MGPSIQVALPFAEHLLRAQSSSGPSQHHLLLNFTLVVGSNSFSCIHQYLLRTYCVPGYAKDKESCLDLTEPTAEGGGGGESCLCWSVSPEVWRGAGQGPG